MPEIDRIVLSCMDRRLSRDPLDSLYNDGRTLFLRNSGANAATALNTIKALSIVHPIKSIVIATHTDCGAMGYVTKAVAGEVAPSERIEKALVSQFRRHGFNGRDDLERNVNGELQKAAIEPYAKRIGAKVEVNLIEMKDIEVPEHEGKHLLTITLPTATRYADMLSRYKDKPSMFDSYFIQANSVQDMLPDIDLAVSALHIHDVRFLSEGSRQDWQLKDGVRFLNGQQFMEGAHTSIVLSHPTRIKS